MRSTTFSLRASLAAVALATIGSVALSTQVAAQRMRPASPSVLTLMDRTNNRVPIPSIPMREVSASDGSTEGWYNIVPDVGPDHMRLRDYAINAGGMTADRLDRLHLMLSDGTERPLGDIRAEAEADLRRRLPLNPLQLCRLNIEVYVGRSSEFAGRDLGLSFCPSATRLPMSPRSRR